MNLPLSLVELANQFVGTRIQSSQIKAFDVETPFPSLLISPDNTLFLFNTNKCSLLKRKEHKIIRDLAAIFRLAERLRPFIDREYCFSICNRDKNITGFPSLCQSRLIDNPSDLLIPDFYFILSDGYRQDLDPLQIPGDSLSMQQIISNRSRKLYWRGSTNSSYLPGYLSRLDFIKMLNNAPGIDDVASCKFTAIDDQRKALLDKQEAKAMREDLGLVKSDLFMIQAKYLLHLDIDGHSCSFPGLYRKLALGGCVLKINSPYIQWYYHMLKDGVNFVSASSVDELLEKVNYFRENWSAAVRVGIRASILAKQITIESSLDLVSRQLEAWDCDFNPLSLQKINPRIII